MAKASTAPQSQQYEDVSDRFLDSELPKDSIHGIVTANPHPANLQHAAEHENTGEHTLQHIYNESEKHDESTAKKIRKAVLAHPNAPREIVKKHFDQIDPASYDHSKHKHLLFHPQISHEEGSKKLREIVSASGLEKPEDDVYSSSGWGKKYEAKAALTHHLHEMEDTPVSEYEHYVKSENHEVREIAGTSPHTPEHVQMQWAKGIADKPEASEALEHEGLSEAVVGEIYKKFKDAEDPETTDWHRSSKARDLYRHLARHPNAPKEHLLELINQKSDEGHYHHHSSARALALAHPKIDKSEVAKALAVDPADDEALTAAVERKDTDPEHLMLAAKVKGYKDKLSHTAEQAIRHPNYPPEEIMRHIKGSTEEARAVLSRSNLTEDQLKALVNHKNKNVAIDALKHHDVTEEVVQEAYKRKAADVSRAAALHPLLPKEQKMEKTLKDPKAAAELAARSSDPAILEDIFAAHKANNEVVEALSMNKAISPSLMSKIHEACETNPEAFTDRWRSKKNHAWNFVKHPDLPDHVRKALIKGGHHDAMEHPKNTIEDLKEAMDHFKESGDSSASYHLSHLTSLALLHEGLKPEIAKEIVQGNFGNVSLSGRSKELDVNARPDIFTPEVVDAALNARPELASPDVVEEMSKSKHLTTEKIGELLNRPSEPTSDHSVLKHRKAVMDGLMANPNLTEKQIEDSLMGRFPATAKSAVPEHVLDHPNLTKDGLKRLADIASFADENDVERWAPLHEMHEEIAKKLMKHAKESGDESQITDLLRNGKRAPFLSNLMLKHHSYGGKSSEFSKEGIKRFMTALKENNDPLVVRSLLTNHSDEVEALQGGKTHADGHMRYAPEDLAAFKDTIQGLADHPSAEVRNAAFQFLNGEGQNKVLQAGGAQLDPSIIQQMKPEGVSNLKINPNMTDQQVGAILKHAGMTREHLQQAVEHSPIMARSALEKAKGGSDFDALANKAMETHSEDDGIVTMAARHGSAQLAGRILNELPKHALGVRGWGNHGIARELVENKNLKADDLKTMMKFDAPEMERAFESALGSERIPSDVLHHIVKTYPKLAIDVARHPKAVSGKVVKAIMKTGDPKVMSALADNDKLPHELQTELFKNPAVLLGSRQSRYLKDDQLQPHLESKDPQILSVVAMHPNASKETASNAVRSLIKMDPQSEYLNNAATRGLHTFDKEVQESIIKSSEGNAATAIHNVDNYNMTPDVMDSVSKALDLYPTDTQNSVVGIALDKNWGSKALTLKTMSLANFSGPEAEHRVLRFEGLVKRHKDPVITETAYKKVKDFSASGGFEKASSGTRMVMKDLFKTIAAHSPPSIQEELSNEPHLDGVLMSNKALSGPTLNKILDRQLKAASSGAWEKDAPAIDLHDIHGASKNESLGGAELDKLFSLFEKLNERDGQGHKDGFQEALGSISKHHQLSPETAEKILNVYPNDAILQNPAIGPENIRKAFLAGAKSDLVNTESRGYQRADVVPFLAKNPALRLKDIKPYLEEGNPTHKGDYAHLLRNLPHNPGATPEDLQEAYDSFKDSKEGSGGDFGKAMIQNSNTPGHILEDMVTRGHVKPEDVWASPSAGGDLFRKASHKLPKGDAFKYLKQENNQAFFRPQEDKIRSVVKMIPQGGYLDWAEFKKANPSLAANPAINKLFTTAPKTRLTREHAEKYLENVPGQKEFHISYKAWNGMQRHSDMPELVVQINNHKAQNDFYRENPAAARLYSAVINYSIASHPVTRQGIGWSRVDVSHPEEYFIDEIQSDYDSKLSHQLHDLQEKGFAEDLQNHGYGTAKDQRKAVAKMVENIQGWDRAVLNNVIETAKKHGIKRVFIQSAESKHRVNKGEDGEPTNKYKRLYNEMPQEMGFKEAKYEDYQGHSPSNDEMKGQKVWVLDLAGGEEPDPTQMALPMGEKKPGPKESE